nr:MAG TPA: DNA-directed RNA polymerase [Caudoviricetes sp.]
MPSALDLAGQKFGKLTVVKRLGKNSRGHYIWRCRCDCGNYVDAVGYAVKNGSWQSCGKCGKRQVERAVDISGQVVGDYMAVERIGTYGTSAKWKCVCTTCGSEKEQGAYQFRIGKRASCPVCTAGMKRGEVIARLAQIKREQSCKQEAPVPRKPKKRPTLEEINAAARAQHMTYGKYMAAYEGYIAQHNELPELEE